MSASFSLPTSPTTWVFAGDSVTQAVHHTYGARGWVELLHEHVRWNLERVEDIVVNTGVSGWTAPQVLERYDHFIGRFSPDVLSISLGTNDSCAATTQGVDVFRDAMVELIRRGREQGAQIVLHTPTTLSPAAASPGHVYSRATILVYVEALRRLADELNCVLVDHHEAWHQHFGASEPYEWLDDWIHPNARGHQAMARLTAEALELPHYPDHW